MRQLIAWGDVWVAASVWTDTYGQLLADGTPVEYIEPAEGRLGWVCGFGISSNAQAPDLAYDYLDAILDPESSANLSNQFYYGTSNRKAFELVDPEIVKLFHLDDPEVLQQTQWGLRGGVVAPAAIGEAGPTDFDEAGGRGDVGVRHGLTCDGADPGGRSACGNFGLGHRASSLRHFRMMFIMCKVKSKGRGNLSVQ